MEYLRNIKNITKKQYLKFYRNRFEHTEEDTEISSAGD